MPPLLKYSNGWGHLIMSVSTQIVAVILLLQHDPTYASIGISLLLGVTGTWHLTSAANTQQKIIEAQQAKPPEDLPMATLTPSGEVAEFTDFDQFETGKSQDTCGPAAVSMFWHCVEPGKPQIWNARQCQLMMESDYAHFIGPDIASDHNGTSNQTLYNMLAAHRFGYFPIPTNTNLIKIFLNAGYPVVIGFAESSVEDMELVGNPYGWDTTGLYHIVVVSGPGGEDELLVRDTANVGVGRPGPRRYRASKLQLTSATVCVPSWMPGI